MVFRIFQPLESLSFDVHDVSVQVPSVFHCLWSDSVKHFDHDQSLQYLIQTIQLLGLSFCNDVVAMGLQPWSPPQSSDVLGDIP